MNVCTFSGNIQAHASAHSRTINGNVRAHAPKIIRARASARILDHNSVCLCVRARYYLSICARTPTSIHARGGCYVRLSVILYNKLLLGDFGHGSSTDYFTSGVIPRIPFIIARNFWNVDTCSGLVNKSAYNSPLGSISRTRPHYQYDPL